MKSIEEMAQEIILSLVRNYKSIELHCEEREEVVYVSIELAKDLDKALKAQFGLLKNRGFKKIVRLF